jgi:hypothetical protein
LLYTAAADVGLWPVEIYMAILSWPLCFVLLTYRTFRLELPLYILWGLMHRIMT